MISKHEEGGVYMYGKIDHKRTSRQAHLKYQPECLGLFCISVLVIPQGPESPYLWSLPDLFRVRGVVVDTSAPEQ